MSETTSHPEEEELVLRVRTEFPDDARATDAWVAERDFEGPFSWLESFADRTTEAIQARNPGLVVAHTEFLAREYLCGSPAVRQLIDVYYAEPLMWNASAEDKCWAWEHIAGPIRELYEQMWGAPHC